MKINKFIIGILAILIGSTAFGQSEKRLIRSGNNHYEEGDYKEAEIKYLKSREVKNPSYKGAYNLGNAHYMQDNYKEAVLAFDTLRGYNLDEGTRAKAYYNLGNSLLKMSTDTSVQQQEAGKALPASIEAFKESLRLDPEDQDAKYNLAYAQNLLKKQQQQQQQQQNQNQDQQKDDQQQDQQQKQDQQQEQQQQNQQEQQEQEQEQQQRQQQQRQEEISKEDAERILQALKNDEKKTLEKLKKVKVKPGASAKSEKDW